jgi:NAD(P)-dependent dehydrogenase (short-subunit alcohol dehydrogenase family)
LFRSLLNIFLIIQIHNLFTGAPMRLQGKVAFITGAGAGIAKASAKAFVREGAKVAIIELSKKAGAQTEQEILAAGGEAFFIETDVTDDAAMKRAVEMTAERFGRLDILLNCAGGSLQEDAPVHEMDLAVWHRTIALNLLHPFLSCRYGIPHMIRGGGGSIINMGSHMGLKGSQKPAYSATKGGITAFTQTLAAQYAAHGIRANAIAPGTVRTERSIKRWESKPENMLTPAEQAQLAVRKMYPFSVGESQDIAEIAVFLASNDSRMLTGTTIAADGGRSSYIRVAMPQITQDSVT